MILHLETFIRMPDHLLNMWTAMRSFIAVMSAWSFVSRPVSGSRMEERLGGVLSFCCLFRDSEFFFIYLRASLGFFMNMASRADPYLWQPVLLASFIVGLVAIGVLCSM